MTAAKALVSEWNRMGSQMRFFVGTLAGIPDALMHYRGELLRVIAQMGLGAGHCRMPPTTSRCASWSPTPDGEPGWTSGPTPASGIPAGPTTSR